MAEELGNDVEALENILELEYKDDKKIRKQDLWRGENGNMKWSNTIQK